MVGLIYDVNQGLGRHVCGVIEGLGLEDTEGFPDGEAESSVIWLVMIWDDAVELFV